MLPFTLRSIFTLLLSTLLLVPPAGAQATLVPAPGSTAPPAGASPAAPLPRCASWAYGPGSEIALDPARELAFVGSGGAVLVLGVSRPDQPTLLSNEIVSEGLVEGLAYDGARQVLLVAAGKPGIELWDVSDLARVRRLSRAALDYYGTRPPALDIAVRGGAAYVAADYAGMHYFDVSIPEQPTLAGGYVPQGRCLAVSWAGRSLYTAQGNYLAAAFTLNGAGIPSFSDTIQGSFGQDVAATPSLAYVAQGDGLSIVDFFSGSAPFYVGSISTPGTARGVEVQGSIAYVADQMNGVRAVDVSDPTAPLHLGGTGVAGPIRLGVQGSLVHGVGPVEYQAIDFSNPAAPSILGTFPFAGPTYDAWVEGTTAFLANGWSGLRIVQLDARPRAATLGVADTPSFAIDVLVEGTLAYVADTFGGLRILDVSNTAVPFEIGSDTTIGYARNLDVVGDLAFVADLFFGLRIDDVSNPAAPTRVGEWATGGRASDVVVSGGLAYVAGGPFSGPSGLTIIDVGIPSAPVELAFLPSPGLATGIDLAGGVVYLADFTGGMRAIDVSNPTSPREVGSWSEAGRIVGDLSLRGDRAYLATLGDGCVTLDISDPSAPLPIRFQETPGSALNVLRGTSATFVSDGHAGLRVFGLCR